MIPADVYASWKTPLRVAEGLPLAIPSVVSEIELQARWFSGQYPRHFLTTTGEAVEIIHLGVWNREPGPDFCEAVVRLAGGAPVRGCIEIDYHRRDWETHGHATNEDFNDVRLHLFVEPGTGEFFTRTKENRFVPQVQLKMSGESDLLAYPPLAIQGRCAAPFSKMADDLRIDLLEAAAQFRLRAKSRTFKVLVDTYGWDEALFQSLAVALGYKENKLPFQLLAQRIGWKTLQSDLPNIEALLFGCAGFLDATSLRGLEADTQDFLRGLWDRWWAIRDRWQRLILPKKTWKPAATRPANHPQRRLAALALIAKNWKAVSKAFSDPTVAGLLEILGHLNHPYWDVHYTLQSRRAKMPISLLGESRIIEMLVNVSIPATLETHPERWQMLRKIQQPLQNRKLKTAILRLFGKASPPMLNVLHQQGILQIYEDFCLRDLTDCARCPFPEKVLQWEKNGSD